MTEYRAILKRVGIALVIVGVLDIADMIYCIATDQSYVTSFNIPAIIAGIFLMRGSLGAARLVAWFFALYLTLLVVGAILSTPFMYSSGLLAAQLKLDPVGVVVLSLVGILLLVFLGWGYWQLRLPPVLAARKASGLTTTAPKVAFGLGIASVVLSVAVVSAIHGLVAQLATDHPSCRISDDCIDNKRYPLFIAREVMQALIDQLQP